MSLVGILRRSSECLVAMLCRDSRNREGRKKSRGRKSAANHEASVRPSFFPLRLRYFAIIKHHSRPPSPPPLTTLRKRNRSISKNTNTTSRIYNHASPIPRSRLCAQAPLRSYSSVSLCASAACTGSPGQHCRSASCQPARSPSCRSSTGCTRSERR